MHKEAIKGVINLCCVAGKKVERMGKVYLTGAGPGEEGLLTIKGLALLKECDCVIYDRLASEGLLRYARKGCEKIYVGKEAGHHYRKQEEINEILVECAQKYTTVVRLKGGDPFVFGRGGEEAQILQRHQIPFEVVPGVSSAIAVPECAGIPVTHRRVSRSFHVITGHTDNSLEDTEYNYKALAELEGTLIFLMGFSRLGLIASKLIEAGKDRDTPVAVIADGTTEFQRIARGTLCSIEEEVIKSKLSPPAVIVIGETASFQFQGNQGRKRIGVTATEPLQKKLKAAFGREGIEAVPVFTMKIKKTAQMERLRQELDRIEQYQWVLFTSQNAVSLFFEEMKTKEMDIRRLGKLKFAVLGSGTAEKLKEYGILADFVPSCYQVSVMAHEFATVVKKEEKVLMPRAVQASTELEKILEENGISFCNLAIYDVEGRPGTQKMDLEGIEYLVFVSASGVQSFFEEVKKQGICLPEGIKTACIGKVTSRKLKQLYRPANIVAGVNNVNGLAEAVLEHIKNGR